METKKTVIDQKFQDNLNSTKIKRSTRRKNKTVQHRKNKFLDQHILQQGK